MQRCAQSNSFCHCKLLRIVAEALVATRASKRASMAASPVCFRPHVGLRFSGSASVNNSYRAQFGDGACFGHLVFAPCKGRESSSRNRNSSSSSVRAIAEPVIRKPAPPTIEECEAAVVAGNPPPAPPVPAKPKAPEGTPVITPLVYI